MKALVLVWTLIASAALMLGAVQASLAHMPVPLLDADGNRIGAPVPGVPSAAFSVKQTCTACHVYEKIEQHSFHAQTGANEVFGWDSWNPDSALPLKNGTSSEGMSWVQTPGHAGNWDPASTRQMARLFEGPGGTSDYDPSAARFNEVSSNSWVPYDFGSEAAFRNQVDLSVAGSIMDCGECHIGGGAMEYLPHANPFARVPLRDIAKTTREATVLDENGDPVLIITGFTPSLRTEIIPNNVNGLGGPLTSARFTAFNYFIDVYDVDGDGDRNEVQQMDYEKTGVLEMDCFMCHLKGYDYASRKSALHQGKLDASRALGAGVASDTGLEWDGATGAPAGYGTEVYYNDQLDVEMDFAWQISLVFNEAFFAERVTRLPPSENCANCHQNEHAVDWKKRGDNWAPYGQTDFHYEVHYSIGCMGCHQRKDGVSLDSWDMGDWAKYPTSGPDSLGHDPAKGDLPFSEVSNVNDNAAFKSCESCHLRGAEGGDAYAAPNPDAAHERAGLLAEIVQGPTEYEGTPEISHIELMDCTACHVRKLSSALWNTGGAMVDATGGDADGHLFDYSNSWVDRDNMSDRTSVSWYKGRLLRNNVVTTLLWRDGNSSGFDANLDGRSDGLDPVLPTQVLAANQANNWTSLTADNAGEVTAASVNERVAALNSLLGSWVGSGSAETRFSLASVPFKVNHSVSPLADSYGIGGCTDCHSASARFYNGAINPLGDGSSLYWDDDRLPYVQVNGRTEASDFDPRLRDRSGARSIALEFANQPIQVDADGNGTPEDYQSVRSFDRSEMLWEADFRAQADFASSYSSGAAIDFSGSEKGWLLKIEASNDGGSTVVTRSRMVAGDRANVAELLADLGNLCTDFEFTLGDNGAGGILLTGQNGYLVRLHPQAWAGNFQLAQAAWQDVQWTGTDGSNYDGRADWVAYLNTLGDPAVTGIGIDPVAAIASINGNTDVEVGSTVEMIADTSVNTSGTFSYSWICSDTAGEVLEGESAQKTFSKVGTWTVTLRVVDEEGKLAQVAQQVNVVVPAPAADISSTDNGSGVPNTLTFSNLADPHTMLYIIWGDGTKEKVYDAASPVIVDHTFRMYSKYFNATSGKYEYRVTVYVYDGSSRVEIKRDVISVSP